MTAATTGPGTPGCRTAASPPGSSWRPPTERLTAVRRGHRPPPGAAVLRGFTLRLANSHSHATGPCAAASRSAPARVLDVARHHAPGGGTAHPDTYHALRAPWPRRDSSCGITSVGGFHYLHHARAARPTPTPTPWARR